MKEKIEKLKSTIESMNEDRSELAAALDQLDESLLEGESEYPGGELLHEAIDETLKELESTEPQGGVLSRRWDQLAEGIKEWENDHPKITMVIGDFARALSIAGL